MKGLSPRKRAAVYARTGGACAYCGITLPSDDFTIDHVHPRSFGGGNELDNLLACCSTCNASKGMKSLEQFRLFVAAKAVTGVAIFSQNQLAYLKAAGAFPVLGFNDNHRFPFELLAEVAA